MFSRSDRKTELDLLRLLADICLLPPPVPPEDECEPPPLLDPPDCLHHQHTGLQGDHCSSTRLFVTRNM